MSLRRLVPRHPVPEFDYPEDIDRIVRVMRERGFEVSKLDAQIIWESYSDSLCASWMMLPLGDDQLVSCVLSESQEES